MNKNKKGEKKMKLSDKIDIFLLPIFLVGASLLVITGRLIPGPAAIAILLTSLSLLILLHEFIIYKLENKLKRYEDE